MAFQRDLDRASRQLAALKELFERHSCEPDARALRWLLSLCRATALDDEYCRAKIAMVEELGAELFSYGGPRRSGVEFLRHRVQEALELLESRLYSLGVGRARSGASTSISRFEVHPV